MLYVRVLLARQAGHLRAMRLCRVLLTTTCGGMELDAVMARWCPMLVDACWAGGKKSSHTTCPRMRNGIGLMAKVALSRLALVRLVKWHWKWGTKRFMAMDSSVVTHGRKCMDGERVV